MPLLHQILRDGSLVDNQTYETRDDFLSNQRWGGELQLQQPRPKRIQADICSFLTEVSRSLNDSITQQAGQNVVLFNEQEYLHNTPDPFVQVTGTDVHNFSLVTGNLVGSIKRGEYSLRVSSRFGDHFLKYIIADADGFLEIEDYGGEQQGDYEWLLVYLWLIKLRRALRLGVPKSYVSRTETTSRVRGRIDPIGYALGKDLATYKCRYREHSYCNPATILISETFRKLKGHSFIRDAHALSRTFAVASEGNRASRQELLATKPFNNPYYEDYNVLIDLSKRILKTESTDFGEESDTSAFFFDVSMLFEYFIRKMLKRGGAHFHTEEERGWGIPAGRRNRRPFSLKPDLVFSVDEQLNLFDVKYKHFDFRHGVQREDLFQLHTYLGQCTNRHKVASCGLIYPISERRWETENLSVTNGCLIDTLRIAGVPIPFRVQFLRVPSPDGENFNARFKDSCNQFLRQFTEQHRFLPFVRESR